MPRENDRLSLRPRDRIFWGVTVPADDTASVLPKSPQQFLSAASRPQTPQQPRS